MSIYVDNRQPTEDDIEKVAASILKHLMANPNEWHDALSEQLSMGRPEGIGEALMERDWVSVGRNCGLAALGKISEDAHDMAESWLHDELSKWQKKRLADWYPVRYPMASREQHWEMM